MSRVVVDLELGRGFGFGIGDLGFAGFDVAVTWSDVDGFTHWPGSAGRALLRYLLEHSQIVGFNLLAYDNRVLAGYLQPGDRWMVGELTRRTVDLHALLFGALGRRPSLQEVATNTLHESKSEPPAAYDPVLLADYCQRDVELTRDLDDFRRAYGVLYVRGGTGCKL